MSMHDYTQHSKKDQNEVTEVAVTTEVTNVDDKLVPEVTASAEESVTEVQTEEDKEIQQPVQTKPYDIGVVTGCAKLRIRSEPRFGTNVICEIDQGTRVMIDKSRSTFDYYKIFTESGVEGFCLKTYIA